MLVQRKKKKKRYVKNNYTNLFLKFEIKMYQILTQI